MARNEDENWLDEAFDERKAAEDMEKAKRSSRLGCILIAVLIAVIALSAFACSGVIGAMQALA